MLFDTSLLHRLVYALMDDQVDFRSRSSRAPGETPAMNCPPAPDPGSTAAQITFNALCSVCQATIAHIEDHKLNIFSRFHDLSELSESAAKGCHFCSLLMQEIKINESSGAADSKAGVGTGKLNSVTRFCSGLGVSFLLHRGHNMLADIDLHFDKAPSRVSKLSLPSTA